MNADNWTTAVAALRKAKRVTVFTGAGVSAESGIPTFRDADGFWQRFPPEQFANWKNLFATSVERPRDVAEFVLNVVEPITLAEPNAGHWAIASLEQRVQTTVVTQNIDGLHQAAGSTRVLEVHGTLLEVVDRSTGKLVQKLKRQELTSIVTALRRYIAKELSLESLVEELCQRESPDWLGGHRPNIVLFGDAMAEPAWSEANRASEECDLFLSVGTSGAVYPAAMLPSRAKGFGATVITIDPHTGGEGWLQGTAASLLPKLIADALGTKNA